MEGSREFDTAPATTETVYLAQHGERPSLARHILPASPSVCTLLEASEAIEHIRVGSFYEIDHSKLNPQAPEQLRSIRVAMVSQKTELKVAVRYPSTCSLRTHFTDWNCGNPEGKKLPDLSEKYIMGFELASDLLYRRIPVREIAEKQNSWNFWLVPSAVDENDSGPILRTRRWNAVSKNGLCWSELKLTGMLQWGKRRQARFLSDLGEQKVESLSTRMKDEEEKGKGKEKGEVDEDEMEEVEGEGLKVESSKTRKNLKRKCRGSSGASKPKTVKRKKQYEIQIYNQSKRKKLTNSIERWSVERYKLAEENMLKILKAKGAVFGNPILRPALRTEARKVIGDTGLLDHLLKHMAGKVAPGGAERFRRRHNAEGAMEYWLESADLVHIRKEAGVQDPYWTPPPGWKPGDNPSQNPICARELRELKEEIARMKKDMQKLETKEQEKNLAIVPIQTSSVTSPKLDLEGSLIPLKEMHIDLINRKAKIEKQLKEISHSLSEVEERIGVLKSTVEQPMTSEPEVGPPLMIGSPTTPSDSERKTKDLEQQDKAASKSSEEQKQDKWGDTVAVTATEDKAAKIERLKSGFRICKPQGTFLWPNMALSPQSAVHVEDLLLVRTPPSASSTTSATHFQRGPHPASPVKPLAERLLVSNALLNSVTKPTPSPPAPPETPHTTSRSCVINLNEPPQIQYGDTSFCGTITYQRRQHNETSDASEPHFVMAKKKDEKTEEEDMTRNCHQQLQTLRGCSSSLPSAEEGVRLALPTSNPSYLDISNRG